MSESSTPMMQQYRELKARDPDALLLFRMGDFYEMFGEDAERASLLLGLTLTSRDKGPNAMPMAGFPHPALETYLAKLVQAGQRAAVCEQVEDAKFAEQLKTFMPAIRNGILMILAHKNSRELLERAGKEQLADEILRESARTMGIEVGEPETDDKPAAHGDKAEADDEDKPKAKVKKKARKATVEPNPIKHVHFSNFIVQ
jgi:DNA mismatch repair ATPase MutS